MQHKIIFLIIGILLIFGCANQQNLPTGNGNTAMVGPDPNFANYTGMGMYVEYPKDLTVDQSLQGYPDSFAFVSFWKDGSTKMIRTAYMYNGGSSTKDPLVEAGDLFAFDIESGPLGWLEGEDGEMESLSSRGDVRTYYSPNNLPVAEMKFAGKRYAYEGSGSNLDVFGYALVIYNPTAKAFYAIRIFAPTQDEADAMKNRVVSTFKIV